MPQTVHVDWDQTSQGLQERHDRLIAQARDIRGKYGDDAENISEKDTQKLEEISDQLTHCRARLAAVSGFKEHEAFQARLNDPYGDPDGHRDLHTGRRTAPMSQGNPGPSTRPVRLSGHGDAEGQGRTWAAQMFGRAKPSQDFPDWQTFARAVHHRDAKLDMTTGSGPGGGYSVPDQLAFEYFDLMVQAGLIWNRCKQYPMSSGSLSVWGFNAKTAASKTLYGAVSAQWKGEGEQATAQNLDLRNIVLHANKLFLLTDTSSELIADAGPQFQQQLVRALTTAASWFLDEEIVNGNGAGRPLGLLHSPCKVTVDKEGTQTANTIMAENIINMWTRLAPVCAQNAVWLCNPDCLPELMQMVVAGASSDVPIWLPMSQSMPNLAAGANTTIMGRPLIVTDHCQTLGTEGDIILFDPTQYALGMRKEIGVESSIHEKFSSDVIRWRSIVRVDGQPLWDSAYTPAHGSDELSCVVTLQTRD